MKTLSVSTRTICGIEELPSHDSAGVTHVLSITDPGWPALAAFSAYGDIRRTKLEFHDVIEPGPGLVLPSREDLEEVLRFGADMNASAAEGVGGHLLVHCHMGISRSTAAMVTLMAQAEPDADEDGFFDTLRGIRARAWPNSLMISFADDLLGLNGRLTQALARHYAHQIVHQPDLAHMIEHDGGRGREVDMGRRA